MARLIETDTFTNKDISTAVAVGTYTATAATALMCRVFADQIAGNGTYTIHLTIQRGGAGSSHVCYDKTASAVASGDTAAVWLSGIVLVSSGDIVTVFLDGLAGDTTTPDTIVEWWELSYLRPTVAGRTLDVTATGAAGIDWNNIENPTTTVDLSATTTNDDATTWAYTSRTLTQAAAAVTAAVTGSKLTITRGDTLAAAFTCPSNTGYTSLWFSVKRNKDDADSAAIIQIKKNASGSGDGLLYLNGATATAANGSLTVVSATALTVNLAASVADDLVPEEGLYYDFQMLVSGVVTTIAEGACDIVGDVTKAIA